MRAAVRILFLLLLLGGLGVLGAQVTSIRAVQGESGQANLWNAILITAKDEVMRPLVVTSLAAAVAGLVGLVLVSVAFALLLFLRAQGPSPGLLSAPRAGR